MKSKRRPILPCVPRDVNPQSLSSLKNAKREASILGWKAGSDLPESLYSQPYTKEMAAAKKREWVKKIEGSLATSFNLILRRCRETAARFISF